MVRADSCEYDLLNRLSQGCCTSKSPDPPDEKEDEFDDTNPGQSSPGVTSEENIDVNLDSPDVSEDTVRWNSASLLFELPFQAQRGIKRPGGRGGGRGGRGRGRGSGGQAPPPSPVVVGGDGAWGMGIGRTIKSELPISPNVELY